MTSALPHVLFSGVVLGQPLGGVRRHAEALLPRAARLLARGGGSLTVLTGRTPPSFDLGPDVATLASSVPAGPPLTRALAERRVLRDLLARRPDFGLVHTGHLPVPSALPVPLTVTLHDLRDLHAGAPLLRRLVARHVLRATVRRAARILTVSETVARQLREDFGASAVDIVPNAGDHLAVVPRAMAAADGPLLHVGHLEPRKNTGLLLEALALDRSLPDLVLVGSPKGSAQADLLRRAQALGVQGRVHCAGALDDAELAERYARASCVVLPSFVEGFGLAVLEAQRAGCPLAIARAEALPEIAGVDVPAFDPRDASDCVRAIHAARASSSATLAEAARRATRFSWERSATVLVESWRRASDAR